MTRSAVRFRLAPPLKSGCGFAARIRSGGPNSRFQCPGRGFAQLIPASPCLMLSIARDLDFDLSSTSSVLQLKVEVSDSDSSNESADGRLHRHELVKWFRSVPAPIWLTLHVFGSIAGGALGGYILIDGLVNANQDEIDLISDNLSDLRSESQGAFREVRQELRIIAQSEVEQVRELTDIAARLEQIESHSALSTRILTEASQPEIQRDFLPIVLNPPIGLGMGDGQPNIVPGLRPMLQVVTPPASPAESDRVARELVDQHREYLISQEIAAFDDEIHAFEVVGSRVIDPTDGTYRLRLESWVVFADQE